MVVRVGLYWANSSGETLGVPLVSVCADFQVVDLTGQCVITQEYFNSNEHPIEAVYLFPLDEKAAVCEFQSDIAGTIIEGVVKEKGEAKKEYEEAVSQGQTASLLEEEEADVFRIHIGNIPPYSSAIVQITYVTELSNHEDKVRVVLPTYVAPRYTPVSQLGSHYHSPSSSLFRKKKDPTSQACVLSMSLECLMSSKVLSITSSTHAISSTLNGKSGNCSLIWKEHLDGDVVVDIQIEKSHEPRFMIEDPQDEHSGATGMISFVPDFHLNAFKGEFIFIIDRSGSMSGKSIEDAKNALQLFLRSLPVDCYFNIVSFGSRYSKLYPKSRYYDDKALNEATSHVSMMSADMGGTEIASPLRDIFSTKGIDYYERQIFLITDGEVSNVSEVINLVRNNFTKSRVFTLGIGRNVSHALVDGVARAGRGTSDYVVSGQSIQPVVIRQLRNSMQPALEDITIDWGIPHQTQPDSQVEKKSGVGSLIGHRIEEKTKENVTLSSMENGVVQAPFNVPPIFSGTKFILYAFFPPGFIPESICVTAKSPDGPLSLTLIPEKSSFNGRQIHVLAARSMIRDLEEGSSYLHAKRNPLLEELKSEVVKLGTKYGLASKYTSFVAVDRSSNQLLPTWLTKPQTYREEDSYSIDHFMKSNYQNLSLSSNMEFKSAAKSKKKGGFGFPSFPSFTLRPLFGSRKKSSAVVQTNHESEKSVKSRSTRSHSAASPLRKKEEMKRATLVDIVLLQNSEGCFEMNERVASALEISLNEMETFKSSHNISENVASSLLILALFEVKMMKKRDEWVLVAEKCRKWIEKQGIESSRIAKLLEQAKEFLSQDPLLTQNLLFPLVYDILKQKYSERSDLLLKYFNSVCKSNNFEMLCRVVKQQSFCFLTFGNFKHEKKHVSVN